MKRTKKLVLAAMFTAMACTIAALCNYVPFFKFGFLSYDATDIMILLCGFITGPIFTLPVSIIVALFEMQFSDTGIWGALMNFLSSFCFAFTASIIYKYNKTIKGGIIGLLSGSLLTAAVMVGWNYLVVPLYTAAISRDAVAGLLLTIFLPFNLMKTFTNSGITLLIYKPIINALRSAKLVDYPTQSKSNSKSLVVSMLVGISLVAVAGILVFILKNSL